MRNYQKLEEILVADKIAKGNKIKTEKEFLNKTDNNIKLEKT